MGLKFEREDKDSRGNFILASTGNKTISIFEIKKGQARGGYYWKKPILQSLISGKVEYRTTNVFTNNETVITLLPPSGVTLPPNTSDFILALDDSMLVEIHENNDDGLRYPKYRTVIEELIHSI